MTFRPYTGKVRLGNSETFLDISELPDGYVLSREGTQIVATLIGQDKLSLASPQRDGDAATKEYVDSEVGSEESSRIAGDADLQNQINDLLSNVDPQSLDSLSEIVSAFQNADGYLLGVVQNLSTGSSSALGLETSARIAADAALQLEVDTEESVRAAGDAALTTSLGNETSARIAADAALQIEVDTEESARAAGDAALATSLGLETSARVAQDGYLHDLIVDEVERASGAEEALQGNIDAEASVRAAAVLSLQGDIDTEESARAAQDVVLQGNIDAEASARASADSVLAGDLDTEESARAAQDVVLQGNIDVEASARAAADADLSGDLDAEESARIAGDANLQNQINNLISNVDPQSLDSLSEIVSAFQNADGYLLGVVQNLSTGSSSALGLETSARIAADAALQLEVDAEESVRAAADAALTTSLGIETSARIAQDTVLQGNIDTESSVRAAADLVLQGNITAEESARVAADATKLSLSGGTMTGAIAMGGSKITGLADGTEAADAVTLSQLQSAITAIDPAGSAGQIQFNADGYDFGASANLAWDNEQNSLFVGGATKVNGVVSLGEVSEVPSNEAGYGKLFAKNDDGLYFVDSEGVNHYILLDGYVELSGTSVALDASPSLPVYRSLTMTGPTTTTFTTSNLGVGRSVSVRLVAGASERTVSFPAGWSWLGGATPTSVPADKVAMLSLVAYGDADTDVIAAWSYNDSSAISGGGTTGQVAFYDGDRSIAGEANLTWDAENDRLVVGTVASPAANLHVGGSAQIDGAVTLGDGYADAITVNGTATFNEPVSMGSNKITDLATPSNSNDAVNLAFLESRRLLTIQTIAGSGTVNADTDVVFVTGSGGGVVRLPEAVAGNAGKVVVIKKRNSGAEDNVGTASGSGQAIDGAVADSSSNLQELMLENESLTFISDGSDWFII